MSETPSSPVANQSADDAVGRQGASATDARALNSEAPALRAVALDDKYTLESGSVFLTGIQALVRLPMEQRRRDLQAGRNTAGYVSGYRGSPLGAFDQQLWQASGLLKAHEVVFNPGLNEDLAATACWGTQQAGLHGESAFDGVFAMWYAKGPGVDRSGDALRHGNLAGSSPLGGVLCLLGDDHICESSTTAHQSEYAMMDAMIPVLNPAGVQEILDYGLYGIAMSRYSGCWTALKCVHDTVESATIAEVGADRVRIVLPENDNRPEGGLNIRWPDTALEQERRLHEHKHEAVKAFCRANRLDRLVYESPGARIGIATTGKSYLEVRQALDDLGIDAARAEQLGLRLYKIALTYPLEPQSALEFCDDLDLVIVVEEKRSVIEQQLKDLLHGRSGAPFVIGKRDEQGAALFRSAGRLDPNHIGAAVGRRLSAALRAAGEAHDDNLERATARLEQLLARPESAPASLERAPYFCPGCPHSSSTHVPEGSRALAGIGCHYLAQFMERNTAGFTQMGGEGASWIGEAPFSKDKHIFQNVGDGTYVHSGALAIRAAVAAGVNVTFKVLFNDAVAMTGGQMVDGGLTVPRLTRQLHAEGVRQIRVVTDEPDKYPTDAGFAPDVTVHHRDELNAVQERIREVPGVTAIVYDQTCASEKRRRRKRGRFPDPPKRAFINTAVCEGCGDCGVKSNCVAVVPVETELGRKRAIDQSVCNKDFSCVNGFCPSFVTVHGGGPRKRAPAAARLDDMPALAEPRLPSLDEPYGIVVTGVGGTGVITVGALLGMAAHLESKGCSVLDQTGLAQKGGAVISHLRIATDPGSITSTRIANGGANLVIGCDLLVTGARDTLATMDMGRTRVVANGHRVMTGLFTRTPNLSFPSEEMHQRIEAACGSVAVDYVEATRIATALMGDSIATNLFMLGFAYQKGLVPLHARSIERAIELNGVAIDMNKQAFTWGRQAGADLARVQRALTPNVAVMPPRRPDSVDDVLAHRGRLLEAYQNAAYAERYRRRVEQVREAEARACPGQSGLAMAVARNLAGLMAYKDEYEVARLYSEPAFRESIEQAFEGDYRLTLHLAPPLLARRDPNTGEPRKSEYGEWMLAVLARLARFKRLRGSWLDPFGWTAERRRERALVREYEQLLERLCAGLNTHNHALAVEIASMPEEIRGFGHIKLQSIEQASQRREQLLDRFERGESASVAA